MIVQHAAQQGRIHNAAVISACKVRGLPGQHQRMQRPAQAQGQRIRRGGRIARPAQHAVGDRSVGQNLGQGPAQLCRQR